VLLYSACNQMLANREQLASLRLSHG